MSHRYHVRLSQYIYGNPIRKNKKRHHMEVRIYDITPYRLCMDI